MKTYTVKIIEHQGNRCLSIDDLVLSKELEQIKKAVGDIDQYPLNKKFKVKIKG